MEKKTNLDKLPNRVKHYLLEWKDEHMEEYLRKYETLRLHDLTINQLHGLFLHASNKDNEYMYENYLKDI